MRLWLTKLSVVIITFMTFGIFIPPTYLDAEASEQEVFVSNSDNNFKDVHSEEIDHIDEEIDYVEINAHEQFISYALKQAKQQSFEKFGPKISSHVGDEFLNEVFPKIQEVIETLVESANEEQVQKYEITEKPSNGYGEKIFHIYDLQKKEDVARFHVRRVNHPREGHSFNFHYHLYSDRFEKHHHLGDIFWDKNTPPKWKS
ncbi:hypothetical protein BKP35_01995 [Anaerobacillus arseniciselenatis]|uniref:Cell division protein FtsK n=1 Tax=Anaerobacillus arseniciselenatis TaxID=85682 RepID=A0A1S2LVV0_9BACI|nr:YpjP family protein [Anaerobacillus arseniciselenatis]OIJ15787.1 hypothetical protein BKP35_01995 [Anaerobacillus arseniciselenatis]